MSGCATNALEIPPVFVPEKAPKKLEAQGNWDEVNGVPKTTHLRIAEGCSYKAEMIFYITDEVVYNGGNVEKMTQFMLSEMNDAEFRIKVPLFQSLHGWVDAFVAAHPDYRASNTPTHNITWYFFNECMHNSYTAMSLKPVALTEYYMTKFGELMGMEPEGHVPLDT
jgi:hypothetical protein